MGYALPRLLIQLLTRRPYGVHSPFLFSFAENCLYAKERHPGFDLLEGIRRDLQLSDKQILVKDFGTGGRLGKPKRDRNPLQRKKRLGSIAKSALQRPKYCRLFFRMAGYFQPATILELGTSLGISTCYLAYGAPEARLITLEGCPQVSLVARDVFNQAGVAHIECLTGPFQQTLPGLLDRVSGPDMVYIDGNHSYQGLMENYHILRDHIPENGVVIIDDIRWSWGMWKAWKEIVSDPKVSLSVDLSHIGILFFRRALSKDNIRMGF